MTDLRRAEEAVIEAAVKWAETHSVTKPSRPEEHNLWARIGALVMLRASQEKPCEGIKNGLRCSPCLSAGKECAALNPKEQEKKPCEGHYNGKGPCFECEVPR